MKKSIWLKTLTLALCAILLLSLAACTPQTAETKPTPASEQTEPTDAPVSALYTAGTYTGTTEHGYHGPITVEVTVTQDAITDIQVVEQTETYGIGTNAVEQMPARILEAQSLGVDTLSGCTISSASIVAAVKNALEQAGADIDALSKKPETAAPVDVEKETDVVVVGGGIAGLAAALGAAESGANVILLEKAAFTGGASAASGGEILAAGTSVQAAAGIEDTAQSLVDYWLEKGEGGVNEEMVTYVGLTAPATIDWLISMGTKLEMETPTSMPWQDPMRCHKTVEGIASTTGTGGGVGFTIPMTQAAEKLGVEFMYETPAQKLIMDGTTAVGVEALTKQGAKVTIKAKNVILATGGFDGNDEMMKQYAPLVMGRSGLMQQHNGDGHRMAEEAGAEMVYRNSGVVALAFDYGPTGLTMADIYGQYLYVLPNGERFMDESDYWFMRSGNLIKNNASFYWTVVPADCGIENLDAAVEAGNAKTGATIAELAQQIGVDPATLQATVDRYNEQCKAGKDADFGKTDAHMKKLGIEGGNLNAIENGPFYAINCALVSISGTLGGPKINLDGQVIGTTGEAIKGLYAAGELANTEFYNIYYPCSGSSLEYCATMGRRTGEHAAKNF